VNDVHETSSVLQEANSLSYARTVLIARTNATYVIYNFKISQQCGLAFFVLNSDVAAAETRRTMADYFHGD
jgi:hypothetical protein